MRKLFFTITAFTTVAAMCSVNAQNAFKSAENPAALISEIQKTSESVNTIQSDFVQNKQLEILEFEIESKGIFLFSKPDKVRWEYSSPYPYLIIMNNKNMTIKDGSSVQKYDTESNRVFKEINDLMVSLLSGEIMSNNAFSVSLKENNRQVLALLTPKDADLKNMLETVEMYFDKNDFNVSEIKMIEKSGDYTQIIFKNRQINVPVPNSRFLLH